MQSTPTATLQELDSDLWPLETAGHIQICACFVVTSVTSTECGPSSELYKRQGRGNPLSCLLSHHFLSKLLSPNVPLSLPPPKPKRPTDFELAYGRKTRDLTFRDAKLIHTSDGTELYRGKLFRPSDIEGADVICKVAYCSAAMSFVNHEAKMYTTKLQHLQGVCIPLCFGYFVNDDRMDPRSCLVLQYSGEPLKKAFPELDVGFKTAIIHAAMLIHNAGVKHGNWREENVLNFKGLPMIIDLEHVNVHRCERAKDIVEGGLAPRIQDFKCNELYQLCIDLGYWKPGMINYIQGYVPIIMGMTAKELAATAPKNVPRDVALKKAKAAIKYHIKLNYPNKYDDWKNKRIRNKNRTSTKSISPSSSATSSSGESDSTPGIPIDDH
ncbi:hypothetical protein EVG20_g10960 [Dentipellis fragilis]|uniref:Protein kinase domain-containing protein n=1 Tax=Dentipellis fragilis TaxID=205917 RepID=A0A4Y9XP75_9AGAM|nr:hypothetical protein EVG20_g10960 [Dentipellis fragilis]